MRIKGQSRSSADLGTKRVHSMKTRDFDFRIKATTDNGRFEGYGSVFNVVDSYREVVAPGAFADSLKLIKAEGRKVPALWQHWYDEPIGVYEGDLGGGIGLEEDDKGLKCEGRLLVEDDPLAKRAYAHMKAGSVSGLSIGYYVLADEWDQEKRIRTLTKLDLREISIVTFPANDDARIEEVRAKLAAGETPSIREVEIALRDQLGFSDRAAEAFAKGGYAALSHRDGASGADLSDLNAKLSEAFDLFGNP